MTTNHHSLFSEGRLRDRLHEPAAAASPPPNDQNLEEPVNILIVDDEPRNLTVLESVLNDPRHRLVRAESADQALAALVVDEFAVIVLDIHMPGMNGFELAQMIKQSKRTAGIPIIYLTAYYSEDQHVLDGYGAGAVDYLHKPINPTILRSKVSVFVDLHRKTRECSLSARTLLAEVTERRRVQQELRQLNERLEQRVAERTAEVMRANEALRASEERLSLAKQAARLGVHDHDLVNGAVHGDEEVRLLWGIGPDEPISRETLIEAIHPQERGRVKSGINHALDPRGTGEFVAECRVRSRRDGVERWVAVTGRATFDNGRAVRLVGTVQDITPRKRAEEALLQSQGRFELALRSTHIVVYTTDRELRYTWIRNPHPAFTVQDVLGRRDDELLPLDQAGPLMAIKRRVLETGEGARTEFEVNLEGKRHVYDLTIEPLREADGECTGVAVAAMEITDRKEAERLLLTLNATLEQRVAARTAEAEARAAQLQALAMQLTQAEQRERRRIAKLLHDHLQQLLVAAKMRSSLAIDDPRAPDVGEHLVKIQEMLDSSIDVSRTLTADLSPPVLYSAGLAAALNWLTNWYREKHQVSLEVEADATAAPLDEDLRAFVFQAARELIFNAVKHAGVKRVRVRLADVGGHEIHLTVEDEGKGFNPEAASTHPGGVGLGLFSIRERLNLLGGRVVVESKMGRGARVTLVVPVQGGRGHAAADAPPRSQRAAESAPAVGTSKVRILVVDDHKIVREGFVGLLGRQAGFEVIGEAPDGEVAVELARKLRPDVVVMDIDMPVMDGIQATRQITAELPVIQVISISMHNDPGIAAQTRDAGAVDFLTKDAPASAMIAAILKHARRPVSA